MQEIDLKGNTFGYSAYEVFLAKKINELIVEVNRLAGILETKGPGSRFVVPTLAEVSAYCSERRNGVDPQKWLDFYTARGFMIGKYKMKDWKASVRTWEKTTSVQAYDNAEGRL